MMSKLWKCRILTAAVFFCFAVPAFCVNWSEMYLQSPDGTFLGRFTNKYDSESIYNIYGNYGSKYSSTSVMNTYGNYGSAYSDTSPFNKYASRPPRLYDIYGNYYGEVTINKYARDVTQFTYDLALDLLALKKSL